MKTPEELAKEYMSRDKVACDAINHAAEHLVEAAFLAGYQAAQKEERLKLAELYSHGSDVQKIASAFLKSKGIEGALLPYAENRFIDGYVAAKEQLQPFHAGADVYIIDANNPLPKPMPLSIAEQYQFADTSKVTNSPETPDSCEHILDMSKMVDVSSSATLNNSSNNSNGWISVKDRLPETDDFCLVNTEFDRVRIAQYGWESWRFNDAYSSSEHSKSYVTHWMPLPKPPEE